MGVAEVNHVDRHMLPAAYPTFCNVVRHMMVMSPDPQKPTEVLAKPETSG